MSLGWSSLTFAPDTEAVRELRHAWAWLLKEDYTPVLFSVLGDMFFEVPATGEIRWLNTGIGDVQPVAESVNHFRELLGTEKANDWFLPSFVEQLHTAGKVPSVGQCYTYVTLPVFAEGKYEVANLNAVSAKEHFAVTAHILREIHELADESKVRLHVAP